MDPSPCEAIDAATEWLITELGPAALIADGQNRQARRLRHLHRVAGGGFQASVLHCLEAVRLSRELEAHDASRAVIRAISNAYSTAGLLWNPEDPTGKIVHLTVQAAQAYRYARAAAAGAQLLGVNDPVTVLVAEGTPIWRARSLCRLLGLG